MITREQLRRIHARISRASDIQRGWGRAGIHFFGFGAGMHVGAYFLYLFHVSLPAVVFLELPVLAIVFIVILEKEITERLRGDQGTWKMLLDITAMSCGAALGVYTWVGWWI